MALELSFNIYKSLLLLLFILHHAVYFFTTRHYYWITLEYFRFYSSKGTLILEKL